MKTQYLLILTVLAATLSFGCGGPTKYVLAGTEKSLGTDGELVVEKTETNYTVNLELEHLPPPNRVMNNATAYVTWMTVEGQPARQLGQLDYDEGDRKGELHATTVERKYRVLVTAEENPGTTSPSDVVVARHFVDVE